ncbi:MAG: M20 family metallopeptidase [Planctomycetota bacterium]|nr:M20 family metallopeptidase [Planctomycetota bacterium]
MTTAAQTTATLSAGVEPLLQRLVRINTVNSNITGIAKSEAPLAAELESLARGMGFETRRMPVPGQCDNLLVTHRCGAGKPWLLFESHMDTVSIEGMCIAPTGAELRDGKIWGRGSCDTKGTGAAMLFALGRYAAGDAAGDAKPNNIAIAFTVDEEIGMTGVRALIRTGLPSLDFKPRGVIVGEPTRLRPIVAHNGAVRWRVVTRGVAAHSADPSKGRSAIRAMTRVIDAIESRYIARLDARDAMTGKAQCSINMIRGGSQINIIPAECEIRIDRRVVPGEDPQRVLPDVEAVLKELKAADPTLEAEQELLFSAPPLSQRHNGALLAEVQSTLGKLGLPIEPLGVPFATDAGDLDAAGIPAIVIGPGDIAQAHTKDEWLEVDQLHRGVELYLALMHG